jgi:hypothetical protein
LYAKTLTIYGFKCFGKADLDLQYPGRTENKSEIDNINLVLGDNGGGKSSVLRALAIAVLAPALLESGFVPYRLVRRPKSDQPPVEYSLLKVKGIPDSSELPATDHAKPLELLARIERRGQGSLDRLHLERTPDTPIAQLLDDDYSPAFFVAGYGATRRVETGEFSESSARRSRGFRYQRVAGLFEDHVALRPLQAWLPRLQRRDPRRHGQVIEQMNRVLPSNIRFTGELDQEDSQYIFTFDGVPTPFSSLSDGYKAFIGWIGDLLGHLADVSADKPGIDDISGIVLVDEIDLHLHPRIVRWLPAP